ncbi:signal peptidase I [Salinigranum sp.]|uniref:signal peptidase I n=1 Tax=Salinigranum sp. TaxID=1966351 RepID=UPI003568EB36
MDYEKAHTLGVVLLVVLVTPAVAHFLVPATGLGGSYVVLSDSMEPTMSAGDLIFVRDVPAENIDQGDVITFRYSPREATTTHRVVDVTTEDGRQAFVTKGDANDGTDPNLVTPEMVVGKLVLTLPLYGHITTFADSRLGTVLLVVVPSVLYLVTETRELWLEATSNGQTDGREHETE